MNLPTESHSRFTHYIGGGLYKTTPPTLNSLTTKQNINNTYKYYSDSYLLSCAVLQVPLGGLCESGLATKIEVTDSPG